MITLPVILNLYQKVELQHLSGKIKKIITFIHSEQKHSVYKVEAFPHGFPLTCGHITLILKVVN